MYKIIEKEAKSIVDKLDFNKLRNSKVLITGASGLIGIYLTTTLKQVQKDLNIEITCWINNSIEPEFKEIFSDVKLIEGDILHSGHYKKDLIFDTIIHAAGYGQPNKFMTDKNKTFLLNTMSTHKLIYYFLKKNGNFLFISTSELYSGLDYNNITEEQIGTTTPSHPRASYIEGKRGGETICHSMIEKGYNIKIVRLALGYGPGTKKNDQRVLNSLIEKGLFNDKIELMDAGDAIRTYCYVTDVVEMIWNILLNGQEIVYNVGGESVTTILELAKLIGFKLGKEVITPVNNNELSGNPKVVNISLDRYINEFKKTDFISLEEGIDNTIKWQKELYGKNN